MAISITFSDITASEAEALLATLRTSVECSIPISGLKEALAKLPAIGADVFQPEAEAAERAAVGAPPKPKRGRPRKVDKNMDAEPIGATTESGGSPHVAAADESAAVPSSPKPAGIPCPAPAGESAAGKSSDEFFASKPAPTFNDARDALQKVMNAKGMEACRPVLKKFGAQRISEVKLEDYAALIAEAEKVAQS